MKSKRGSALAASLIISAGVGLVVGSTSNMAVQESKLNKDAALLMEAKNAAEAVVEFGFADLSRRFDSVNAFPMDALAPTGSGTPLRLPSAFYTLFEDSDAPSHVIMPPSPYDPYASWGSYETELIGGIVPPGEWKFISSQAPGNEFDPLKDKMVWVREVKVYGKATVENNLGQPKTAYCSQELQVRDAPLFAHAIFYNMDMEIAPGAAMDIRGAVHANGNLYVQTSSTLNFYKNISAVGKLRHGPSDGHSKATDSGNVQFIKGNGTLVTMKNGSGWYDSKMEGWRSLASNRWEGNVQDGSHGIQKHNPVAMESYLRDDPNTSTKDDQYNPAYQMIMPLDPANNAGVEEQKFEAKAGLVIEANKDGKFLSAYTYSRDINGNLLKDGAGNPYKTTLTLPSGVVTNSVPLYDKRRGQDNKLLQIDVGRLRDYVHDNKSSDWGGSSSRQPQNWWNGVIYVKFPNNTSVSKGPDGVRPSVDYTGMRLVNGRQTSTSLPGIPDPNHPSVRAAGKGFSAPRGMTIATNNVLYVQGDYNADGKTSTGSATEPDDDKEPPAALAADAITVLSNSWNDSNDDKSLSNRQAKLFTEVSAAFLTGIVASDKANNNRYSGGVENFPRFLEDWSPSASTTFRYRGSMVALFESEIANEAWGNGDVYDPPTRAWGFHRKFAEGLYPPGTPNTRTYRRINFRHMTQTEWNTEMAELKSQMGI